MKKINQTQTNTQEKKKENFFKKHWKKIVGTTVVICGATVSVLLIYNNGNKNIKLFSYKEKALPTSIKSSNALPITILVDKEKSIETAKETVEITINVGSYIRQLPAGKKISFQKKEQMLSLGIYIDDKHTLCNEYTRKIKVPA